MSFYFFRKNHNRLMLTLLSLSALVVVTPLVIVFCDVLAKGFSSLDWALISELPRPVGEVGGGMHHALMGTIEIVGLAALMGVPWGLGAGVYLSEYGQGFFSRILRFTTDLLSGTPSIVIGIFAYLLLVKPFKGFSGLAGALSLSIVILPTVIRTTEEILKLVPRHIREAGLALGLPRWKVILWIVICGSRSGLLTGVMLAIARAAGETAPLIFTAFGNMYLNYDPRQPTQALPIQIYTYAISPFDDWHRQAWAGALLLILLVFGLNVSARFIVNFSSIRARLMKGYQ